MAFVNEALKWALGAPSVLGLPATACHAFAKSSPVIETSDLQITFMPASYKEGVQLAMLRYAEKLTLSPGDMQEADVTALKNEGISDGEILEANQIIGYFNYVNRLLSGLGVSTDGDIVGYY